MSDQAQGLRTLADQARRDNRISTRVSASDQTPVFEEQSVLTVSPGAPLLSADSLHGHALAAQRLFDLSTPAVVASPYMSQATIRQARVIAVTSGKGGVGKTNFSTNLSILMAQSGQRVVVLDADLGLANLHVVLGVSPRYHLEHVMQGEITVRDALHEAPGGIQIIGGGSGIAELANLEAAKCEAFIASLSELDALADVIVIDTGAGLARNTLAFLNAVEEIIVVTTPEPTAITDAYATIKISSIENPNARLMLVVNMAQSESEGEAVANRLGLIARQFLGVELEHLGTIVLDPCVGKAVRIQQPFVLSQPHADATQSVQRIASRLGYHRSTHTTQGGVNGLMQRMRGFFSRR
jgi:flagellar biosynthesis protein FlhG